MESLRKRIIEHSLVASLIGVVLFIAAIWPVFISNEAIPSFLARKGWGITMPSWYYIFILGLAGIVIVLQVVIIRAIRPSKKKRWPNSKGEAGQDFLLPLLADLTHSELQQQTLQTVQQIRDLLEQHTRETNKQRDFPFFPRHASEEAKRLIFQRYSQEGIQISSHYLMKYNKQFLVNAILLRDELLSRLPPTKEETQSSHIRFMYENPTNPSGIELVANDLERLAKSLPTKSNH